MAEDARNDGVPPRVPVGDFTDGDTMLSYEGATFQVGLELFKDGQHSPISPLLTSPLQSNPP